VEKQNVHPSFFTFSASNALKPGIL